MTCRPVRHARGTHRGRASVALQGTTRDTAGSQGPAPKRRLRGAGPQLSPQCRPTQGPPGCLPRRQAHLVLLFVRLCSLGMAPSDDSPCPFCPVYSALRRRCLHSKSPGAASPKGPRRRPHAAASGDCRMIRRMHNHHQLHNTSDDARVGPPWAPGW